MLTEVELHISGMTCDGCKRTVQKKLLLEGVNFVEVSLEKEKANLSFDSKKTNLDQILNSFHLSQKNYKASLEKKSNNFWNDFEIWKEASKNTLNCLIGCSIGDFAMMTFLQMNYPNMNIFLSMSLAIISGLITSVIFETLLLRFKNRFSLKESFNLAISMSFLSMVVMELAENITDYILTKGEVSPTHHFFWTALVISMIAGFLIPLPYNYYKLKKFGKACH